MRRNLFRDAARRTRRWLQSATRYRGSKTAVVLTTLVAASVNASHAAEFFGIGPADGSIGSMYLFENLSADGSTIIGNAVDALDGGPSRWTRDTGNVLLNLPGSTPGRHSVSEDGSLIAVEYADHTSAADSGGVWTQDTGWQFPANGPPTFSEARPLAVSTGGSTAVGELTHFGLPGDPMQAFRWTRADGYVELGLLPGQSRSVATAVSTDAAVIVGISDIRPSCPTSENPLCGGRVGQLFRWTADTEMTAVAELPAEQKVWRTGPMVSGDGTTIVVTAAQERFVGQEALYRSTIENGLALIINDISTTAGGSRFHTSDDGSVVVASGMNGLQRWSEHAGVQTLPHLPGGNFDASLPLSMTADGSIVFGVSRNGAGGPFQFGFWTAGGVVKTLEQVFQEQGLGPSVAGWQFPYSRKRMSADGRVLAGMGINPNGVDEVFVAYLDPLVIPEPTGAALILIVAAGLACSRRVIASRRKFTTRRMPA